MSKPDPPPAAGGFSVGRQSLLGLAPVFCLVVGVGVLTWMKTINYPRADLITDQAAAQFRDGSLALTLESLARTIDLAPDVSTYHRLKSGLLSQFRGGNFAIFDKRCGFHRSRSAYDACRAEENYSQSLEWVGQRAFSFRSRFALANDAYTLATLQGDANRLAEAKRLFEGVADMAHNSYAGMSILAEVYIKTGRPGAALKPLERSLSITRGSEFSSQATVL